MKNDDNDNLRGKVGDDGGPNRMRRSTLQDSSEGIRPIASDTKCSGVSAGRGDL